MSAAPDGLFLDFQSALAGRYALERELGRGGMGIVYRARDLRLERVVAIKLLPRERARTPAARDRFLREARTAARLSHPHIIPIHAVEEADEFVYFVMGYVDGETLGARVRRDGSVRPHDAARILREVAWALAYAHGQGVIHRDVKPENILLEREGDRALVADFGIARAVQAPPPGVSGDGELVGTPEYMSPVGGLELELARRREEQEFAGGGDGPTRWERWMRTKMYASLGLAAASGAAAFVLPYPAVLVAFGLFGLSCATAVATGLAAWAASRGRLDEAEQRRLKFWKGFMGRWLFKLAGIGLKRGAPGALAAGDRPTEAALGLAALELFEALPADTRRVLGDLPGVVRRLEARVRRLRGNGRAAEVRDALSALETIRLDLLRLHGGVGTVDGLTADLGAARLISEQVDALLEHC